MHTTITISDADRSVDYTLAVAGDFLAGSALRRGWLDGGNPGEAPAVEINRVRCLEIVLWCGTCAVSLRPDSDDGEALEWQVGAWCLDHYADQIEEAVLDAVVARHAAARETNDNAATTD